MRDRLAQARFEHAVAVDRRQVGRIDYRHGTRALSEFARFFAVIAICCGPRRASSVIVV